MDISLSIPCYNAEKTISLVLKAALSQTYPPKEIIVVNDGSTDRSKKVISEYPVKLLTNQKNRGIAYTRNKALKNISSEFVASLDADCIPEKDWLEKLIICFEQSGLSGVVGVGGRLLEKHSAEIADNWRGVAMRQHWGDDRCVPPYLFGSNTLFSMTALREVSLYDETYTTNYEDVDICSRLKVRGYTFAYEPDAVAVHCKKDNISSALFSYWKWQLPPKKKQARYETIHNLKEQISYNLSYSLALINKIVLTQEEKKILYPSLLAFFSHSFLDVKFFIRTHIYSAGTKNTALYLKDQYGEMVSITLEWFQKKFYLEKRIMDRVLADLEHISLYEPGIVEGTIVSSNNKDRNAKKFIEFFYTRVAKYLSSLDTVVFDDTWKSIEKICLK